MSSAANPVPEFHGRLAYLRSETASVSSPTGNFCGTHGRFVVFSPLSHGLWLSLVERLNGVQEVPGSNPGSPIFPKLGRAVAAATGPGFLSRQPDFPKLGETCSVKRGSRRLRGLRGLAVRGVFVMGRRKADGDFSSALRSWVVRSGRADCYENKSIDGHLLI